MSDNVVVKSAAGYMASNLLVKASGFITIPIFTRLLSQAEYGQYNNFLSWVTIVGIVTSMSLESTLISAKQDYEDSFEDYAFSISIISIFLAGIWWLLAWVLMPFVSPLLAMDPLYIHAMFIYLLFQPIVNIYQTRERFLFKWKATVATSVAVSVGSAVLSVLLVITMGDKLLGVIAGRVAPMMLIGALLLLACIKQGNKFIVSCVAYALPIAAPFIPHLLAMNLLGSLNKIFIEQACGSEANAMYSLANNCGLIVSIFTTSLNGAFAPWLGERLAEGEYAVTRKVGKPYILLFALLAIGASLFAPEIMYILGGPDYIDAASMIPAISMGCVFQFAYCMYVNIEQFKKKTVGMALASASAAVVNAALDIVLIPRFGYQVAAIATAISYAWLLFVHMALVSHIGLLKVYDVKYNIIVIAITTISMVLISAIYPYPVARIVLAAIVLFGLILLLPSLKSLKRR